MANQIETKSFSVGWIVWLCIGFATLSLIFFVWPSPRDPGPPKITKPIPRIASGVFKIPAGATVDVTTKGGKLLVKTGDLILLEKLQGPARGLLFINSNLDPIEIRWPDRLRVKNTEGDKDPIVFKNMNKTGTPDIVLVAKIGS